MSVPSCNTCLHARRGDVVVLLGCEITLRCVHPALPDQPHGDPWFARVVRGFETDERGAPWCGSAGAWHEPRDEDDAA